MKINKNILIIVSIAIIVIIVWLFASLQSEKQFRKFDKKISDEIIKNRYIEFANKEAQAKRIIKTSEIKYDSIYQLHLTFENRYKKNNQTLYTRVHEIKTLNISTRSRYVDSVLKYKGIRSNNNH